MCVIKGKIFENDDTLQNFDREEFSGEFYAAPVSDCSGVYSPVSQKMVVLQHIVLM